MRLLNFCEKINILFFNIFFKNSPQVYFEQITTNSTFFLCVHRSDVYRFLALLNFFVFSNRPYLLDIFIKKNKSPGIGIFYVCSFFFLDLRVIIKTKNCNTATIKSVSGIWPGSVWAERESSEFSAVSFSAARDSRRLLTDYTCIKKTPETHETYFSIYSHNYSEVVL